MESGSTREGSLPVRFILPLDEREIVTEAFLDYSESTKVTGCARSNPDGKKKGQRASMRRVVLPPLLPPDLLDGPDHPFPYGAAVHVAALQHGVRALGSL